LRSGQANALEHFLQGGLPQAPVVPARQHEDMVGGQGGAEQFDRLAEALIAAIGKPHRRCARGCLLPAFRGAPQLVLERACLYCLQRAGIPAGEAAGRANLLVDRLVTQVG